MPDSTTSFPATPDFTTVDFVDDYPLGGDSSLDLVSSPEAPPVSMPPRWPADLRATS